MFPHSKLYFNPPSRKLTGVVGYRQPERDISGNRSRKIGFIFIYFCSYLHLVFDKYFSPIPRHIFSWKDVISQRRNQIRGYQNHSTMRFLWKIRLSNNRRWKMHWKLFMVIRGAAEEMVIINWTRSNKVEKNPYWISPCSSHYRCISSGHVE